VIAEPEFEGATQIITTSVPKIAVVGAAGTLGTLVGITVPSLLTKE
jgi:hypothetical protein